MLGKIDFEIAHRRHEAWLNDDLTWGCDDPALTAMLNDITAPVEPEAPFNDHAVQHMLYRVAYRIGGRVTREQRDAVAH